MTARPAAAPEAASPGAPAPSAPALTRFLLDTPLRQAVSALTRPPEPDVLPPLVARARLPAAQAQQAQALALRLARGVRERGRSAGRAGLVQGLLQEFALSSQEGVALMCLAEALLRIPDLPTRDALIRDKISRGNWQNHLGQSPSVFVNAAAWGLLLTGRLVSTHSDAGLSATLRRAVARGGEPLIRKGVDMAMRMMGEQFVTGETIEQALQHAAPREAQGFRFSYDMLGEGALTSADAQRYLRAYEQAIHAIGLASQGRGIVGGPGISIKLSALHPRYARAQIGRVMSELYPRLLQLARLAHSYDIGLNIDAEESERLELSLDLLERLCFEPALAGWNGIGFVIQAYQKRCPAVVEVLVDLARRSGHRLMVRLVKGAYWDSEIKRAQQEGQSGYPVYSRKPHTDVAYLACARQLLAAPDAIYPQFATHNAHTLAAIHTMAGEAYHESQYEFQCLHGMGEPLYEQVVKPLEQGGLARPCRIYAPVGTHDTLLAYLVRRLLENGANSSFVNRIADENLPLEALVQDPVETVEAQAAADGLLGAPHPAIPLPAGLYGERRRNSPGLDLSAEAPLRALQARFALGGQWHAAPLIDGAMTADASADRAPATIAGDHAAAGPAQQRLRNPAAHEDRVGTVRETQPAEWEQALAAAVRAAPQWAQVPPVERAACLDRAAAALESQIEAWLPWLAREAGKTCSNGIAEVREAADFLRYYAAAVREGFDNTSHRPLGPVVCISPWNFPLAIFVGQVSAALAAGNVVLAKPAEQTPLVAAQAVRVLHEAGIPRGALQLLPGRGETVGAALVADARVQGVLFTGSTEVARLLQRSLAQRLTSDGQTVPLIAETGGQNALVVDSSALVEQAVGDILSSAFDSAGQRCSALRLLCVQEDAAERVIEMLDGAMRELRIGDPRELSTDCGPVIDAEARDAIERHIASMAARGCRVRRIPLDQTLASQGSYVAPTLIEIDRVDQLQREVFGPVLHVLRYARDDLADTLQAINATGYGLTQGVHSRIDETVAQVLQASCAGNIYVNRNIVGAVVGVQPFGGEGLSGTGPKAGGPLYLMRLLAQRPLQAARLSVARQAARPGPELRALEPVLSATQASESAEALRALRAWALEQGHGVLAAHCDQAAADSPVTDWLSLPGPTGESNLYAVLARDAVLCLAQDEADQLAQLATVLAVGSHAVWPAQAHALRERLPGPVRERIRLTQDWSSPRTPFDAVVQHGSPAARLETAQVLAARPGPLLSLSGHAPGERPIRSERLVLERAVSLNTAAAGGNASLMTLD
ncbi:MAG: trifunctional transcriptional regulator/proline dehydrogenase/L-glutamate gamma-semialdehyde dehydrogenase [Rubrivivax sp.]|nr:trifunctional transcriptional regulator/proline dehydrogenase/L-glutamate gamma-semialdehyde dehydrogenase [Rubrivivax sp.]